VKHEYDYNPDLITEDTEIPPEPKKNELKKKPEMDTYKAREKKIRDKVDKIRDQIKDVRAEKFKASKKIAKGEGSAHDEFREQIEEIQ